ncbi:MAG TPA: hypothetical protein VHG28_01340 [Longimicrobiaceae bacterium]|nr:hypothetical protein [Longimicrobiaceae bacterium]
MGRAHELAKSTHGTGRIAELRCGLVNNGRGKVSDLQPNALARGGPMEIRPNQIRQHHTLRAHEISHKGVVRRMDAFDSYKGLLGTPSHHPGKQHDPENPLLTITAATIYWINFDPDGLPRIRERVVRQKDYGMVKGLV